MSAKETGRARQAKGLVQEAIGKIIGDPAVEKRGSQESKMGAKQAETESPADKSKPSNSKDGTEPRTSHR